MAPRPEAEGLWGGVETVETPGKKHSGNLTCANRLIFLGKGRYFCLFVMPRLVAKIH